MAGSFQDAGGTVVSKINKVLAVILMLFEFWFVGFSGVETDK